MKLLHTADLHGRKATLDDTIDALTLMRASAWGGHCDLIAIAGDIHHSAILATEGSGFNRYTEAVADLAAVAPVVMIYGTPSHDVAGSLEIFERMDSRFPIVILRPGQAYYLTESSGITTERTEGAIALLFGIPEPSKAWLEINGDTDISGAMRRLLLGLAALRKEHADLPALMLYHGQVRGAKMQNGQLAEGVVGAEDLDMVNADYYALGDIHEPQQIGEHPMYYPGSPVPQNWGETHKGGYNIVEIAAGGMALVRKDLPFPQRKKITTNANDSPPQPEEIDGRMVWWEITAEKGAEVDAEGCLAALHDCGAVEGSRVTVNVLATETVRAEEIRDASRLRDKLSVWADASETEIPETAYQKADQLEEKRQHVGGNAGAHIRLDRLRLRGAIGLWKRQRLDEVEIDLSDFDEGLIALVGPNGYGKSTLIENCHPWPQLLTRDGKLQDHFRLRDSCRDLYFTDTLTDIRYRALLKVDGQNKSGSVEYYLYWATPSATEWQPLPDINGRRDPYVTAIEELWGSLPLYLRTAFVTQRPSKGNPEISDATKGERKALLRELAGLDYLQEYREQAKVSAGAIEIGIQTSEGKADALSEIVENLPIQRRSLGNAREELETAQAAAAKAAQAEAKADERVAELSKLITADEAKRKEKNRLESAVERNETDRAALASARELYAKAVENRAGAEAALDEIAELRKRLESLRAEKADHDQAEAEKARDHRAIVDKLREYEQSYRTEIDTLRDAASTLRVKRAEAMGVVNRLDEELAEPLESTCLTCGQELPPETRRTLVIEWEKKESNLRAFQQKVADFDVELAQNERETAELQLKVSEIPWPADLEESPFDDSAIRSIEKDLAFADEEQRRQTVDQAKVAVVKIENIDLRTKEIDAELDKLNAELDEIEGDLLPENYYEEARVTERRLAYARQDRRAADAAVERKSAEIEAVEKSIADLERKAAELEAVRTLIITARREAGEWRLLERACGADGIQALELDALSPSISSVANALLEAAYGPRYRLEFRTTRTGGSGSRAKQIEDFLIMVVDSEDGSEQEISTLSGGESVWIKRALYDAFAIVRARSTGVRFLTTFADETDGALDPDARIKYLAMMEAAHHESGRHHTVMITHSSELQQMIEQRIDVTEIGAKEAVAG